MGLLRERFTWYDLQLHPDKTRVISFGGYEVVNAKKQKRGDNIFDFLGLRHYCSKSRHGGFLVGRKTVAKRFRKKIGEMKELLKSQRNMLKLKDLWKGIAAKLQGHYQYYGISGNYWGVYRYYICTIILVFKWLNR
jgi:hypothetical protein